MRFALNALTKSTQAPSIKVGSEMINNFVCEPYTYNCAYDKCVACKGMKQFDKHLQTVNTFGFEVSWDKWRKPETKTYANIEKISKKSTVTELIQHISVMRDKFVKHAFVKKNQSTIFKKLKEVSMSINSEIAVIQVDWAENVRCFYQNEPQAAHFGQNQVSIMTLAVWNIELKTFAIVLDSTYHTKSSVILYIDKILHFIPDQVKEVHMFSNNATSQFKNKSIMAAMVAFDKHFHKKFFWHFAAMHLKGLVDGIGATVKQIAPLRVKSSQYEIRSAADFALALQDLQISVIHMSENDKRQQKNELGFNSILSYSRKIKGISKSHYFYVQNDNVAPMLFSPEYN